MNIGALGEITFEVSEKVIQTIRDASVSGSAEISVHKRHLRGGLAEYTGYKPNTITFSLRSSAFLGAAPAEIENKLEKYKNEGTQLLFVLGTERIGYKWLLQKFKETIKHFDIRGNPIDADFSITLIEYIKE